VYEVVAYDDARMILIGVGIAKDAACAPTEVLRAARIIRARNLRTEQINATLACLLVWPNVPHEHYASSCSSAGQRRLALGVILGLVVGFNRNSALSVVAQSRKRVPENIAAFVAIKMAFADTATAGAWAICLARLQRGRRPKSKHTEQYLVSTETRTAFFWQTQKTNKVH
jgi:hypothetical protein